MMELLKRMNCALAIVAVCAGILCASNAAYACEHHTHGNVDSTSHDKTEYPATCASHTSEAHEDAGMNDAATSPSPSSSASEIATPSGETEYGMWAWRWVVHFGCGGGDWYYVRLGSWNTLVCPYDGYIFSAYIPG